MEATGRKIIGLSKIIFIVVFIFSLLFPGGTSVFAEDTPPTVENTEVVVSETPPPDLDSVEQPKDEAAPLVEETPAEVITAIVESGSVITDESGVELPMAAAEVVEMIAGSDPYIIRGAVTFRFLVDCSAFPNSATQQCIETTHPVQMAVNFAESGETVNIEANTYNETVQISTAVILNGVGGNAILDAFILMFGEDVTGSTNVFAPLVYVNNGAKINDGLLLADENGTVHVAAGTYPEQIKIKKSVKLVGAGKASTNILYSGALTDSGSYDVSSIIDISGMATNAEVTGFNIAGGGLTSSTDRIAALYVFGGATANIHDNRIALGDTGTKSGVGVQVGRSTASGGSHGNATIWNNQIVNFTTLGVTVEHDAYQDSGGLNFVTSSSANIHHNLIDGAGITPVGNQIGIQVFTVADGYFPNNATAIITNNLIQNNASAGIFLERARNVNITDNRVTNNSIGVRTNARVSGGVHNNSILSNTTYDSYLSGTLDSDMFSSNYWGTLPLMSNFITDTTLPWLLSDPNPTVGIGVDGNTWAWYAGDYDGDGVLNGVDNCPTVSNADQNIAACDGDVDDDLILNNIDNCPTIANHDQLDSDIDGIGDTCDPDGDNDGVPDTTDNCPAIANADQLDTDLDGIGDACDPDMDGDGDLNAFDNCPLVANSDQADTDLDGIGDVCDPDMDGDGVLNITDNCPAVSNADQTDSDVDGIGDPCDTDNDGDGVDDFEDNCPTIANSSQSDTDLDGLGDACDLDMDGDGNLNAADNCPLIANSDQADTDLDGIGDVCDPDMDGDGVVNITDNCPAVSNTDQTDSDLDGIGNACDPDGRKEKAVAGGFIPVTGGNLLSCIQADKLEIVLPDGSKLIVAFNQILCDYEATLIQEKLEVLPLVLPDGATLEKGLTYSLSKDGVIFDTLPDGTEANVRFFVGTLTDNFSILFWDKVGGKWEDIGGILEDDYFSVKTNKTGTFVLVTK